MMLRLGLEAGPSTVEFAKELDIKGVPVSVADVLREGVDKLVKRLRNDDLEICQVGAFGYNPLHPDSQVLERETAMLRDVIPMVAATGCPYIVICGGNYHPSGFLGDDVRNHSDDAINLIALTLRPLLELAERHGAKLSIEPYIKTAIDGPRSFLELYRRTQSSALKINFDVTSLYQYGDLLDPTNRIVTVCNELKDHFGLIHFKEVALRDAFHIHADLVPIGDGPTDWGLVLEQVFPFIPSQSWTIIEHVQTREEARRSVGIVRREAATRGYLEEQRR